MEWLIMAAGILILSVGMVIFVSPMPFGFVFIIPGLALLVIASDTIANFVFRKRKQHDKLDRNLDKAEDFVPDKMSDPLEERTDPDERTGKLPQS